MRSGGASTFTDSFPELTADAICHFCRVAKEASGRRVLVGTYYGYLTQHGSLQQDSSHAALGVVLQSPDVDFLMSPPLYTDRQLCGTSGFMSATESVRLRARSNVTDAMSAEPVFRAEREEQSRRAREGGEESIP